MVYGKNKIDNEKRYTVTHGNGIIPSIFILIWERDSIVRNNMIGPSICGRGGGIAPLVWTSCLITMTSVYVGIIRKEIMFFK